MNINIKTNEREAISADRYLLATTVRGSEIIGVDDGIEDEKIINLISDKYNIIDLVDITNDRVLMTKKDGILENRLEKVGDKE